jgi:hypothetical protein
MAHHPEGNGRNGRNVALPDENRPSWRPQDEAQRLRRSMSEEDDRYEDDRYARHWEDRSQRDWEHGAGPGTFEERYRERGGDERFGSRGGSAYYERDRDRSPRGYGYGDGDRPNLGTGGAMHGGSASRERGPSATSGHRGKGPASYQRSDERLRELVCEALTEDDRVDASNIEVSVKAGEVTLTGQVDDRLQKRAAEDCVENVSGVKDVQNRIRFVTV